MARTTRSSSKNIPPKSTKRRGSLLGWLGRWLLKLLVGTIFLTLLLTLPLRWLNPPTSAYMLRDAMTFDRQIVYQWQDLEDISWTVQLAVIAAEDQRFFRHSGMDWQAIQSVLQEHEAGKKLRGASTISQQVVKNLYLWPGQSTLSKWLRKAGEAWFTIWLEWMLPKQRILEIYVNIAELGPAIYGIGAASQHYFSTLPSQLSESQAAALASMLPSPTTYSMFQPHPALIQHRQWIQRQMRQLGGRSFIEQQVSTGH